MERRKYLTSPQERPNCVYFIEDGFASLVVKGANGWISEAGLIGREGLSGIPILFGNDDQWPHETFVQHEGVALRIDGDILQAAMEKDRDLRRMLLTFVQVLMTQMACTAHTNNFGRLEQRLARWLLMSHDRVSGDELSLVHAFLAEMLGVRRAGVTEAVHRLEGKGLIKARRGSLTIVDREGLINESNGFYGVPEAELERLIG